MSAAFRILYIGGSYPQRLAVKGLTEAGFEVHVADRSDHPPAAAYAAAAHIVSATDAPRLIDLARELSRDGTGLAAYGIADYACASVARINEALALPGQHPGAIDAMIDKEATKGALRRDKVPIPETLWAGEAAAFELTACRASDPSVREAIVKPADVHASQGIARVRLDDAEAVARAVRAAGDVASTVLIEEYLEGEIWNVDALAIEGTALPVSVTRRRAHDRLAFLPCLQVQPCRSEESWFDALAQLAQQVAASLGYRDGPFTVDFILSASGPKVLEVSPHFHSIAMEILRGNGNPLRAWMRYLAGDSGWRDDLDKRDEKAGALAMLRAENCGTLDSIAGEDALSRDPRCGDYVRLKADEDVIRSLSAPGGLLALAWWSAPQAEVLQTEILDCMSRFRPCIEPVGREVAE